jgi:hypothetical protein
MNLMQFQYEVVFERIGETYRLISYNTPWENERELDDIKVMFEGKDLKNTPLPAYKAVKWEDLGLGKYRAVIDMKFIKNQDDSYDQLFKLTKVENV